MEPDHEQLSISQQWELLGLPRSSYYYHPIGESSENVALMLGIDKLFTDRPELGLRRMQQKLTRPDNPVNGAGGRLA